MDRKTQMNIPSWITCPHCKKKMLPRVINHTVSGEELTSEQINADHYFMARMNKNANDTYYMCTNCALAIPLRAVNGKHTRRW